MMKLVILVACFSGALNCMDTAPDIDMMVLKKIGTAKIEEALKKSVQQQAILPSNSYRGRYSVETDYLLEIEAEIIDTTEQDSLTRAIMAKIEFIEKRDGGYYPHHRFKGDAIIMPKNKLDDYTTYWRERNKGGMPCIRYHFACEHKLFLEKALQALRTQNQ